MLPIRGTPQLLSHRPQWRQQPICRQCLRLGLGATQGQRQQPWYSTVHTPRRRRASHLTSKRLLSETDLAAQLKDTGLWSYGRWADAPEKSRSKAAKTKKASGTKQPRGDRSRVNIVSEKLTDDLISYLGPNFVDRHKGCDIIDIYPGAGLWSSKLHEALQPRSHILMEPDATLYKDFLSDLVAKPNVTLVPLSGIIWRNLTAILTKTYLPHQVEIVLPEEDAADGEERPSDYDEKPLPRNDTLLITANLAFYPRRHFGMFDSLSQLVLYQFISSIRANSLFHKYGLVRMLIWVEDEDRHALVARSCQRRKRLALDGEMATEWITELAGRDIGNTHWFMRDHTLDLESCRRTLGKMEAEGIAIPKGRETLIVKELRDMMGRKKKIDFSAGPRFRRPYLEELEKLEAEFKGINILSGRGRSAKDTRSKANEAGAGAEAEAGAEAGAEAEAEAEAVEEDEETEEAEEEESDSRRASDKGAKIRRLKQLRYRRNHDERTWELMASLMEERDRLAKLHRPNMTDRMKAKLKEREDTWNELVEQMNDRDRGDFLLYRDNLHLFRQAASSPSETRGKGASSAKKKKAADRSGSALSTDDPILDPRQPLLSWDRRNREPLVVQKTDFFPNTECVLMDIQPKSMHRLFRAMGPGTNRAGDHFELILKAMMAIGAEPVSAAIETVWPGAAAGVLPKCPSLYDPKQGGCPVSGPYGELSVRSLNERQWSEILEAWMAWPFRPMLGQLVQRVSEEGFDLDEETPRAVD